MLAALADGSVGVVRIPSLDPPDKSDPALLLTPGHAPVPLAPWSTLSTFDKCLADASAVRTLVMTDARWLALEHPNASDDAGGLIAALRWSQGRVCIEIAEVGAGTQDVGDRSLQASVIRTLSPPIAASRHAVGLGGELIEPASCKLVNP